MAGDQDDASKTEEPSAKRLEEAFKKGDVAKSQEVTTVALLIAATAVTLAASGLVASSLSEGLFPFVQAPHAISLAPEDLTRLWQRLSGLLLWTLAVPFVVLIFAGVVGNLIQHPPLMTTEKMKPDLKKISPLGGLKRMFGPQGWVNLLKGVVKILVVAAVVGAVLWPESALIHVLMTQEPGQILILLRTLGVKVLAASAAVVLLIAIADLAYQKHTRHQRLRMTKQEVKDEFKQAEGDPHVKGKLRQLRAERGKQRMMAAVPEATVVLTNPTHYAVALKYESDTMAAPICVAKGIDAIALKIRSIAEENGVAVVENPPLARALHATVDIDEPVPPEHYKAVAQVIGFVWRTRAKAGRRRA
ncbi:MAG: flagellar biosynthesis protein FlhB [Alphaproteobacteria bacterium]